ncbi:hypothetical protein SSS_02803 [Sarcoptes scabiei]|uniref:Uncharacterized protein n=1 Tax=Sarcoptes scabiei TaxID=52283 RepID=A0A834RCY6_SARSC|nr:hypothetical protein SSS_02803 [Sarcoptes scabiei]
MNQSRPSLATQKFDRFKSPLLQPLTSTPVYGKLWTHGRSINRNRSRNSFRKSGRKSFLNSQNNKNINDIIGRKNYSNKNGAKSEAEQRLDQILFCLNLPRPTTRPVETRLSRIVHHNDLGFIHSLRNFHPNQTERRISSQSTTIKTTSLARHMKMSREIVDDFVRVKTDQYEASNVISSNPIVAKIDAINSSSMLNNPKSFKKNLSSSSAIRKRLVRPKSAGTTTRRRSMMPTNSVGADVDGMYFDQQQNRYSTSPNSGLEEKHRSYSDDEECANQHNDEIDEGLKPLFHRSMDKISSIAKWERQIRYEFEIEKELHKRELERQREKLQNDQRKLENWDKQLRIELDARERKLKLGEEELKSRSEELNQKMNELLRREQLINEIVNERIKSEMKFEIEKLRKKFNELEIEKNNLSKKEERVKEVEARLHEQVKIVKEKIDGKRLSDIELAKYRKELEITRKENEVLKEKVDSMEDYQITKFENKAFRNELQLLKEALNSKNQELERDRERLEREQRASDQKIMTLRHDLRKSEQELMLLRQKSEADNEEITSKYEAANGQVKRLQAFIRDYLAKMNNDFMATKKSFNHLHLRQSSCSSINGTGGSSGPKSSSNHQINHLRGYSLGGGNAAHQHHRSSFNHQRSISMDGFHHGSKPPTSHQRSFMNHRIRGCRLCDDEEFESDENEFFQNNQFIDIGRDLRSMADCIPDDDENEDDDDEINQDHCSSNCSSAKNQEETNRDELSPKKVWQHDPSPKASDEFVRKIVDKIYEKISTENLPDDDKIKISNCFGGDKNRSPSKNSVETSRIHRNFTESSEQKSNSFEYLKDPSISAFKAEHAEDEQNAAVHSTLYEELMMASNLKSTSSPLKQPLPFSPLQTSISKQSFPSKVLDGNHSLQSDNNSLQIVQDKLASLLIDKSSIENDAHNDHRHHQNDPNNNRINLESKTNDADDDEDVDDHHHRLELNNIGVHTIENNNKSDVRSSSTKSESFEDDW